MTIWMPLCFILLGACAVLVIRLVRRRRQLALFTRQLKEIREQKQNRLIRVEQFDKGTVELAKELQAYVDEEQTLIKKAEEERQAVKTMVAGISHDFRTPLTAASGYMQMIAQDQGLSPRSCSYLEKAMAKTTYLKELSDEFFALSLVEGKTEELSKLSLKRMLEEVTLAQYEWIEEAGIEFHADVAEDGCELSAVEVDILRLLENLYSNAKKYARGRISIRLTKMEENGIELVFSNDGELLTEMDVNSIFQPFYRSASGDQPGSGLGLYVVKRIVEKYNGKISASINENGDFEIRIIFL
ncbi:MAG: HAMP domain-containing histidine kinase [Lachnospiraceae bacterium]|nr:HAMP domain-containing histidine kinase [Lachnospiraceae bacterium]